MLFKLNFNGSPTGNHWRHSHLYSAIPTHVYCVGITPGVCQSIGLTRFSLWYRRHLTLAAFVWLRYTRDDASSSLVYLAKRRQGRGNFVTKFSLLSKRGARENCGQSIGLTARCLCHNSILKRGLPESLFIRQSSFHGAQVCDLLNTLFDLFQAFTFKLVSPLKEGAGWVETLKCVSNDLT
eukprot:sb/3471643/